MDLAILLLLQQHNSLAASQVAEHLGDPLDAVNATLRRLRDRGAVDVLAVGQLEGHTTEAASYWRLTDQGRDELASRFAAAGHRTRWVWWGNTQSFKQCDGDFAGSDGWTVFVDLHQLNH